jgi:signal transduction histidine kinase/response regulator RpfG family c-di-GMP phosphodiesterase
MRILSNISIKNKLRIIIILTSAIVLFLALTAFMMDEFFNFRRQMVNDLFVLADLVGINSSAGLLFDDSFTTEENIVALKAHKHIILTHIFSKEGNLFASYFREGLSETSLSSLSTLNEYYLINPKAQGVVLENNYFFHDDHVDLFKRIIFEGEFIGTVYIQSDLEAFKERLFWAINIVIAILVVSLLLAFILASKFQRVITVPIDQLLTTMKGVSQNKNYSLRAQKNVNDELGDLVIGFNQMLAQIEKRDIELGQYHNHLEDMVSKRTAELTLKTTELAEARDQALAANKAKSAFLANMSHELRTPLNGILGYAQILNKDKKLDSQQKEGVKIIQRSGDYLLTLISDILDLSKIEAGKIELYPAEFHLAQFLNSIADLFQMRATQKGIAFHYEFPKHLPTGIHADEKRLRQILINLLSNAIKFTKQGKVRFQVDYSHQKLHFQVSDTGMGIAQEELESIFLPFRQAGDSNYKAEGTGLGLSITKKLVEMMGGQLQVDSTLGQGSTFWMDLDLPVTWDIVDEPLIEKPNIIGYQGERKKEKGERYSEKYQILVVDDKWENRVVLIDMLTTLGFEVVEAVNGQEAFDKACASPPDLVIMDLMMPVMDGFEATRQMRQVSKLKDIPILAASASVFEYHRQESINAGCSDFIAKPIRSDELLDLISKHLHLTWVYEEKSATEENEAQQTIAPLLIGPSTEQASNLFDLAMMGDINGIMEEIEQLENADAQLAPFVNQIREFANNFELEKISDLVQKYLDSSNQETTNVENVGWVEQNETHQTIEPIAEPSPEQASKLLDLAMMGDINGITELAEQLEQTNSQLAPFAEKIRQLANNFDIAQLIEIAQRALQKPSP